jgi:hypothetical protein
MRICKADRMKSTFFLVAAHDTLPRLRDQGQESLTAITVFYHNRGQEVVR